MKLNKLLKTIYWKYLSVSNPKKLAKIKGVQYGDNFHIYGRINWGSEPWLIHVGNNVFLTSNLTFITHDGGTLLFRDRVPDLEITKPINIGNNVYIGVNVTILPGVSIGDNVIIGAGSVVTKDIPGDSVVAGNPAKYIKSIGDYFEKIKKESIHLGHLSPQKKEIALREHFK